LTLWHRPDYQLWGRAPAPAKPSGRHDSPDAQEAGIALHLSSTLSSHHLRQSLRLESCEPLKAVWLLRPLQAVWVSGTAESGRLRRLKAAPFYHGPNWSSRYLHPPRSARRLGRLGHSIWLRTKVAQWTVISRMVCQSLSTVEPPPGTVPPAPGVSAAWH